MNSNYEEQELHILLYIIQRKGEMFTCRTSAYIILYTCEYLWFMFQRRKNLIPFEGAESHAKCAKNLTTLPTEFKGHAFVQNI